MKKIIIGICGFSGSGKDTVADILIKDYGFVKESFASTLKDSAASIFSWDRKMLEGNTAELRKQREEVDDWWSKKLNIKNFSPRLALQLLGTEVMRNNFHKDIWVLSMENKLSNSINKRIVITDCRFSNEFKTIINQKGLIVRVDRGKMPIWLETAKKANLGDKKAERDMVEKYKIHITERGWVNQYTDWVFENNGSILDLKKEVEKFSKVWEYNEKYQSST